jgi:prepilin-type N-terminal cleavage/methylation domain-containing protein
MIFFNKQSGFSLVETLVAISLLLIIIVGPMSISAKTAKSSSFANEQIQAFFLAQEGLELSQKARDDFRLNHFDQKFDGVSSPADPWDAFKDSATYSKCFTSGGCGLYWGNSNDGNLATPKDCNTIANCRIYKNDTSGSRSMFTYDSTSPNAQTVFTRKVTFENLITDPNQIKVASTVTWRTGSLIADQKVEIYTYLLNTDYDQN